MPVSERKKKCRHRACVCEAAGRGEHGAEAAGLVRHEAEQDERHDEQEGRGEGLEEADGFHAAPDDDHVEEPEAEEAEPEDGEWLAAVAGQMTASIAAMDWPPIQDWMPNQPQATIARSIAGMFAPRVPKLARTKTGKGMPYLAPAWALSSIGMSTMRLPSRMVPTACFQFMPPAMSDDASM